MATVENRSGHVVDLSSGLMLAPGGRGVADLGAPHDAGLIAAGVLVVIDPDTPAPPPATTVLTAYIGPTQPVTSGAALWVQTDDETGEILDLLAQMGGS